MKLFVKGIFILSLLFFIFGFVVSVLLPVNEVILEYYLYYSDFFTGKEEAFSIFANRSYLVFQTILVVLILFNITVLYRFGFVYEKLTTFFFYTKQAITNIGKDIKSGNIIAVLIIPFVSSIYFAFTVPVSLDEGITYLVQTNKPIFWSYATYLEPNNHVLHSLITHITKHIPFFNMLFCIRVSSIIASLFAWIILYSFVKRFFSEKTSLFTVALSSMMFMSVYYSYMSRGYGLTVLFFTICLYAAFSIIKNGSRNKDWVFFTIAGTLGAYTIPSFLYPFAILNVVILIFNYKRIRQQICFNALAGIMTFSLYIPIMMRHGIKALTANGWVAPIGRAEVLERLPGYFSQTINEITGIPLLASVLIILSAFIYTCWTGNKQVLKLWAVFALMPPCILLLHSVIPFPRTFVYYAIIMAFIVGISYQQLIDKLPKTGLTAGLIIIQALGFVNFYQNIGEYESFNTYYHDINKRIIEKGKTYYVVSGFDCVNHRFEMLVNGCNPDDDAVYEDIYWTKKDVSADSINGFDYIVIDVVRDKTVLKKPIYSNKEQNLYAR
ncbi:glycosyltransferase family 39 protein [Dysgonomonas sp. 511]|uniref:glycosyltransferase family 39 protein n=1 Tax=Dysgonomonas sp. 511 TaxID=2302930 RepID=UPI0013D6FA6A|nr:glycosyltransferase family 39 protein [Dysgonomonas sp. 511]NDV78093.1 hypothetical protein [Dysgonomonas sp. 511]